MFDAMVKHGYTTAGLHSGVATYGALGHVTPPSVGNAVHSAASEILAFEQFLH